MGCATNGVFDDADESVIARVGSDGSFGNRHGRTQVKPDWNGVFPAVTTQFREDLSLDVDATARVIEGLIRDGVSGLIVCGTVGENCSLARHEKIAVMEAAKGVARGRVPVLSGIAEFTAAFAIDMAKEAARAGLDDVVLESIMVGAVGWVSGMSNAFPREGETLFRLARAGRYAEAMSLYRWFMPLLHLDSRPDLVQCIKLCEHLMGRGTHRTRPPRLSLQAKEAADIEAMMKQALATRPRLPDVGLRHAA